MRIVVDAMGGDHAPGEVIQGALDACRDDQNINIILVGQEKEIIKHLPVDYDRERISIHHCEEIIGMEEHPATTYRRKKDASITVATRLLKEKMGDALVSAGSTGAQMVAALFGLGRIKGIDRPAIVTVIPSLKGPKLLLDAGANADCKPENILQFAKMGSVYAEKVINIIKPSIGLISNGTEPNKGNDLTIKAYELLKNDANINFLGNVEGRELLTGEADVFVCDGFVGNIMLKVLEGTAGGMISLLKEELKKNMRSKLGAILLAPALRKIKSRLDYSEYGGAPLLGVDGISIICHGSSKAYAIKNAIYVASACVNKGVVKFLGDSINKGKDGE
ncbi:MAG: phosphate acyltransferase PlsX [Clostridia bacterium]|nr:phosphate acyltransferase PlsX [Clostridia bacterium]MDD4048533.1 phosphate acyltransferase PlsX [Clostridia bacterium]